MSSSAGRSGFICRNVSLSILGAQPTRAMTMKPLIHNVVRVIVRMSLFSCFLKQNSRSGVVVPYRLRGMIANWARAYRPVGPITGVIHNRDKVGVNLEIPKTLPKP
jgi:hypothetical protein